jgi:hypothetical protein
LIFHSLIISVPANSEQILNKKNHETKKRILVITTEENI